MAVIEVFRRNDVLNINPPGGDTHISTGGSDWMWTVTAIYLFSFLVYVGLSFRPRNGEKIFHYLFTIALFVGSICYFAIASDLAWRVIPTELYRGDATSYQIFWPKYVNWVVSFPIILIALGLISGVSWASIIYWVFLSWVWVISYLCSAFTATSYKWGFYAFGTFAMLLLILDLILTGRKSARRFGTHRDFDILAGWLSLLFILYPIAYAVSDGGNVIHVTKSLIYFGIIDVLMLIPIAFGVLALSRKWDYGALNLHFTQYGRVPVGREGVFPEKQQAAPAATPATAPATAPAQATV